MKAKQGDGELFEPMEDPAALSDLLLLIGEQVSPNIIGAWTVAERNEVTQWAGRELYDASDNVIARLRVPKVIEAHRQGKRPHLALGKPVYVGNLRDRSVGRRKGRKKK